MSQDPAERGPSRPEPGIHAIESLAFGGEGISRKDGKVSFVPGALPGELVEAVQRSRKRRYDRLQLVRVVRPSPERKSPICPHTDLCGGCVTQTLRYESQLAAKAGQVRDCLERIGRIRIPEAGPPLGSPVLTGYRNKMEFSFAPRPWLPDGPPEDPIPGPALGLHVPGRFDAVFDLEYCALPSGAANAAVHLVRDFARERGLAAWRSDTDEGLLRHLVVREGKNTGEILLALVARRDHPDFPVLARILNERIRGLVGFVVIVNERPATIARGETEHLLFGRPYLLERLCGMTFEVQAQSFFQTNTWGAEVLVQAVRRMLGTRGGGHLLDLYCGAGTLGLLLSGAFDQITGVEQVEGAVGDAVRNAERNEIRNSSFLRADVEEWLQRGAAAPGSFESVIVDPPRAGLHPNALRGILRLEAPWLLFVSCNPSTLARDGALLQEGDTCPRRSRSLTCFPTPPTSSRSFSSSAARPPRPPLPGIPYRKAEDGRAFRPRRPPVVRTREEPRCR